MMREEPAMSDAHSYALPRRVAHQDRLAVSRYRARDKGNPPVRAGGRCGQCCPCRVCRRAARLKYVTRSTRRQYHPREAVEVEDVALNAGRQRPATAAAGRCNFALKRLDPRAQRIE